MLVGDGGKAAPDNSFSHVDSNEQTSARVSDSVALGHDVVKQHGDNGGECELENDQDGIAGTNGFKGSVHAGPGVSEGLPESDENTD